MSDFTPAQLGDVPDGDDGPAGALSETIPVLPPDPEPEPEPADDSDAAVTVEGEVA